MTAIAIELARESARALYEQLIDQLRQRLLSEGESGAQLPTEESLMEMYCVSRSTVRKAIQRLVDEGILVRRQGKGTFVARPAPHIIHSIDRLAPFVETFTRSGEAPETKLIDFAWIENPELPKSVQDWERPILRFRRLYVSAGVPHAVTQVCLPGQLGRRISRSDVEKTPVYEALRRKLRIVPAKAEFLVSCRPPTRELSETLDISPSTFLLILERVSRDRDGQPIELTTHFLRADVYQLSVEVGDFPRPQASQSGGVPSEKRRSS